MNWPEAIVVAVACISFAAVLIVGIVMLANIVDDDPFADEEEDDPRIDMDDDENEFDRPVGIGKRPPFSHTFLRDVD